jgi:hypothetical protein
MRSREKKSRNMPAAGTHETQNRSKRFNTQLKLTLAPFDPDLRPKGVLTRPLNSTPGSSGHPDPAAGQTPVFGGTAAT